MLHNTVDTTNVNIVVNKILMVLMDTEKTVDLHGLAWEDAIDTGTVKILADCGVEDAHLNKKKLKVTEVAGENVNDNLMKTKVDEEYSD